MELSLSSLRLK